MRYALLTAAALLSYQVNSGNALLPHLGPIDSLHTAMFMDRAANCVAVSWERPAGKHWTGMVKPSSLSMTAVGIAVLIGAAGCTRTSDGSYVLRRPAAVQPTHTFRAIATRPLQYQVQANEPRAYPPAYARPAVSRPAPRPGQGHRAVAEHRQERAIQAARSEQADFLPQREPPPSGRIRVVCS